MPNDPRVRFHKGENDKAHICKKDLEYLRKHPECRLGHRMLPGGGGGTKFRSIYEENEIEPPPDPGGGTGGGTGGVTPRDIPVIPQPIKPTLDPGAISGATIGSIAAAAALTEVARRTLNAQRQRQQGFTEVSQKDLSSRQSGTSRRTSKRAAARGAISRTIETAGQAFEMMTPTRPTRPTGPIQAEFAPLSVESSPSSSLSSSGTTTPDLQSARSRPSSGTTTPDLQSARSRPSSGATTPGELSSFNPGAREFQQQPSALAQELERRQIEILNPDISEARTKTLQNEINALEDQIRASGGTVTSLEDRINSAINTTLPENIYRVEEVENILELTNRLTAAETIMNESLNTNTSAERYIAGEITATPKERMKYFRGRNIYTAAKLEKEIVGIELKLLNPTLPQEQRQALVAEQEKLRGEQRAGLEKAQAVEKARAEHIAAKGVELESRLRPKNATAFEIETGIGSVRNMSWVESLRERLSGYRRIPLSDERGVVIDPTAPPKTRSIPRDITDITAAKITDRPAPSAATPLIDEGAGLGIGSGREALGMSNEEFANRLERARLQSEREIPVALDPKNSEAIARARQMNEYMREGDAEIEFSRQIAEAERQSLIEAQRLAPAPIERPQRVMQEIDPQIQDFLEVYNNFIDVYTRAGNKIPEVPERYISTLPEGEVELRTRGYILNKILKKNPEAVQIYGEQGTEFETTHITGEELRQELLDRYNAAKSAAEFDDLSLDKKIALQEGSHSPATQEVIDKQMETLSNQKAKGKGKKLTKKTGLLATEEQRLQPTALAREAQARVRAGAPAEVRATASEARVNVNVTAPEARIAAPEARVNVNVTAPEARPMSSAPEARVNATAPEVAARRRLGVPELTAPPPAPPEEMATFAERQAFFEESASRANSRRVAPPTETPISSAPPSAPGTETSTPREGIIREQTPAERAAFAEEVSLGLKGKKVPGRQKAKINSGRTNKATVNPLEKFVGPQFRNTPNLEIHPSAKNLRGALAELGSRVPKLVPSKKVLLSAGANLAAEGGGMVTGFFAGSEAGKAMNKYFATHPPTNRTDEYGQALATSMVALGVGNLVSKAVTYALKQGARIAMGAEITGSISGAGIAGASAIFEAGVFATVATTTQFFVTKALEDSGHSHAFSRTMGSVYATEALMYTELVMWLGKGGPVNLAGDVSFLASELFIIGFGIWSAFEEFTEGTKEDQEKETFQAEQRAERARAEQERRDTIAAINRTNAAKAAFLQRLPLNNYDFDALYARLTDKEKQELGITSPETKLAFQRDVERAFDPFGAFQKSDNGLVQDPPIQTQVEKDRSEVMNSYINWYIDELRGVRHEPFNFDDPKVRELNEYSGGTWKSAAQVSASTNHLQAEQVHPLIERAQNEIIDAFHNERKTIEQMDELTVRYATLDPTFRANYEAYIITDAAAQILVEFNNTQSTYNEVDPALLAIADRDPNFRAAADAYYQVLANQARDYQLTISEVAHLNSLMENEQEIELGKLNEARNRIIEKNQAENQAMVDAYNANILREINIYGDNFEAIIRNINEQSLLSGHTFLYASNRADLYRQLHLEVPEIEFVDPVDEIDGKRPDATWHQGKGRKAGDTAIYHYRYNLTDEQNQEIEDLIASNQISRFDAEKQGLIIYNRDRAKFVQTDEEKAADLGLSLDAFYKKFGIVDPTVISTEPTYKDLQILYPEQYRNLRQKYANDPDANKKIEETLARAHKRRMEESGGIYTPLEQAPDLKVEQLQQMYPDFYESIAKNVRKKDGSLSPESVKFLEISLRMHHELAVEAGTAPPVPVETRDPTYEELQLMYPEQFDIYNDANTAIGQEDKTEMMLRRLHRRRTEAGTAPPLPEPTIVIDPNLKNGIVNMPDGSTRTYRNGLVVNVLYRNADEMKLTDFKNAQEINEAEGVQKSGYAPTKTEPTTTLRQGALTMPDGSKRFYVDGKVVSVDYPEGVQGKTIKEINDAEGINSVPIANQAVDPGGLPTQIQTPTELTYEQLQVMYPDKYQMYNRSYANSAKYGITPPSPEEQATMIEGLLREEHANRTQAGTAQPLPTPTTTTTTPTTNQPLPFVPGARSFEYADSGTQAPATNP